MNNKQNKHSRYPLINKHVLNKCERMSELVKEKKTFVDFLLALYPEFIINKKKKKKKNTTISLIVILKTCRVINPCSLNSSHTYFKVAFFLINHNKWNVKYIAMWLRNDKNIVMIKHSTYKTCFVRPIHLNYIFYMHARNSEMNEKRKTLGWWDHMHIFKHGTCNNCQTPHQKTMDALKYKSLFNK